MTSDSGIERLIYRDERTGVWMMVGHRTTSAARDLAWRVMDALQMDSVNDFKTRDKIIVAISGRLEAMLDSLTAEPASEKGEGSLQDEINQCENCGGSYCGYHRAQVALAAKATPPASPEVIEGSNQFVGDLAGWYLREAGGDIHVFELHPRDTFTNGFRYMRCPTFPPRPMAKLSWKPNVSGQVATVEGGSSYHIYEVRDDRWIWFYGEGDAFTVRSEREAKEACENHLRKTPPREPFTAPPRPELVLVRYKDREQHYTTRDGSNYRTTMGRLLQGIHCVVIDELTGKPIKE
jgi:hypothetical protein